MAWYKKCFAPWKGIQVVSTPTAIDPCKYLHLFVELWYLSVMVRRLCWLRCTRSWVIQELRSLTDNCSWDSGGQAWRGIFVDGSSPASSVHKELPPYQKNQNLQPEKKPCSAKSIQKSGCNKYLFVACDNLSGWVEAEAPVKLNSRAVTCFFSKKWVQQYGLCICVTVNGGPDYQGYLWTGVVQDWEGLNPTLLPGSPLDDQTRT